jgi:pSer/pThr/pTyr-binding forkhead associated (FHA) protein
VRVVESYSAYIRRKDAPASMRVKRGEHSRNATSAPAPERSATAAAPAAAASSASASKLVLTGRTEQQSVRVEITADELERAAQSNERGVVIGRSRSLTDKVVDDPSVSRRHAKFFLADGVLMVEDMGSAYGVKVNGKPVPANEAVRLKPGDKLALGGVTLDVSRA